MKKYKYQNVSFTNIIKYFTSAVNKFRKAKKVFAVDEETAYQMFYEAMLKASLALMLSYGYRPRSLPGHHRNIIEFSANKLDKDYAGIINTFNKMRRRRNQSIYNIDIEISETEARYALKAAEEYLKIIKEHINNNNPQLKLRF